MTNKWIIPNEPRYKAEFIDDSPGLDDIFDTETRCYFENVEDVVKLLNELETANAKLQKQLDAPNKKVHEYIVSLEMGLDDLLQQNTARETELTALRAAYEVACEIFCSQAITMPRLRDAWNTAVQQVEATE